MSLDIYPSEKKAIEKIVNDEVIRLRNNGNKLTSIRRFAENIEGKLSDLGFIAVVSTDQLNPDNYELGPDDTLVFAPKVDIMARVEEKAIDFDKMIHEAQHGVHDGQSYKVDEHGNKKEV